MVVRLQVNDNAPAPYNSYQIGRATGLQCFLDISEIIAFESAITHENADKIEGYLAHKWGLTDQLANGHPLTYLSLGEIEFFLLKKLKVGYSGQRLIFPARALSFLSRWINPLDPPE